LRSAPRVIRDLGNVREGEDKAIKGGLFAASGEGQMGLSSWSRAQLTYYTGLGREAYLLIFASAVASFNWGVYSVIPGVYLPQLGLDQFQVSTLYSVSGLTSAFVGIPLAMWSERHGRKKGLSIGIALAGSSMFVYSFSTYYPYLLASSFVQGLGYGLYFPNSSALLAERTTTQKRTVAFSLSFFTGTAASAVGTLFSGMPAVLRGSLGFGVFPSYQAVYALAGMVVLSGCAPLVLVRESERVATGLSFPKKSRWIIVRYSLVNILIGLGAGLIIPIFSLWFHTKFGYDETVLAPLNFAATIATAAAGLLAPKVADLVGDVRTVLLTTGTATLLILLMPATDSFALLSILFVARQFLMNMSSPVFSSFYMTHVDPEERASASAISGTSWSFPNAITPSVGGYLMKSGMVDLPLYLCGASYAVGFALTFLFFDKLNYRPRRAD